MSGFDTSGLRSLAVDLGTAPTRVAPQVLAVVKKAAVNVKTTMQDDAKSSPHFKGVARDITYDVEADRQGFTAEIGPEVGKGVGHQGSLAFIAYNGTSRGGGGTVRDPQHALDEEAPKFRAALSKAVGDATL